MPMNSVGIDISKGRSTIAVMRPFGEVIISPFEVRHTDSELSELARQLKSLDGETRVVMETTGNYHAEVFHEPQHEVPGTVFETKRSYGKASRGNVTPEDCKRISVGFDSIRATAALRCQVTI